MIRKFSLAKGMFSTKIYLAKGIRLKTRAAHPRQNFFWVPPGLATGQFGHLLAILMYDKTRMLLNQGIEAKKTTQQCILWLSDLSNTLKS